MMLANRIMSCTTTPRGPQRGRMPTGPHSWHGRLRSGFGPSGRLLLPLLLMTFGAGPAFAQAIPVRAGEHEDFTRLVLRVPEDGTWALVPAPGGFELRGPPGTVFETDEVFGRIPRNRIAALEARGDGRLGIAVACDCHGKAFWQPEVGFVVDVIDGPVPPGAISPAPVPPTRPARDAIPLMTEAQAAPLLPGIWDLRRPTPSREAARVARTEAAMLDSIVEAARQGFLDLAPGVKASELAPDMEEVRSEQERTRASALHPGLELRTGAEPIGLDREPLGATGAPCLPAEDFDLEAWAGSGDFAAEIPARIAAVIDARDVPDPLAAEALARAYLAFGFGREARVALDLDRRSSRGRDVMRNMAGLLDGEAVAPSAFEDQAGCLGPVALWRALARGTLQGTDDRERTSILLALRDLPTGAHDAVALRLAGLFLDAGDPETADEVAARSREGGGDALLARAEIAEKIKGPEAAVAELGQAAERNPRMTPEALAELLDLLVDEGSPVSEDLLELARTLRFEHGNPRVLLLAEARALAAESRFEEALALLDGERATAPGPDIDQALATVVESLTIELGDGPFLELVLGGLPRPLPAAATDAAARRLSDLGFPDEAWRLRASVEATEPSDLPPGSRSPTVRTDVPPPVPAIADTSALARAETTDGPEPAAERPSTHENGVIVSRSGVTVPPSLSEAPEAAPATVEALSVSSPPVARSFSPTLDAATPERSGAVDEALLAGSESPPDMALTRVDRPVEPALPMSLADRRALLVRAEDVRTRAAALLGQEIED